MIRSKNVNVWKATPSIAIAVAAMLLVAGLAVALYSANASRTDKIRQVTVQANILAAAVSAPLSFNDQKTAREYVNALNANSDILRAGVYDSSGKLFASLVRPGDAAAPSRLADDHLSSVSGGEVVVAPIVEGDTKLGTVHLEFVIDPIWRRLGRLAVFALLAMMAAIIVAVLGIAHATLNRANSDLQQQSLVLADANRELLHQIDVREKAEAALRQAQKMEAVGQLTGGVAHDFNNLLQIIMSSLGVLRRRSASWTLPPKGAEDFKRYMDAATTAGERAAALTRQLLAFARRQPLEPTLIDLNRLVAGMSELLRRTIGEAVSVETVLAGGIWLTFADQNQLESALVNLAVNARDAMPEGGKLTLETANSMLDENYARLHEDVTPGQYVMIAVTDTGCGMTADVIAQVFEPFFTTKDIGQGTGLGLSQVYGFVRQSGGHIKIYSEPGDGTTVKIYLPRLITGQSSPEASAPQENVPGARQAETILVVEDEDAVRSFSVEMLRELGYQIIEASDGISALQILASDQSIQLLFTDIGLPGGLNGRELAEKAKRHRPGLKVVFTSGYTRNAIVHGGRLDPGVALVAKPFTYSALAEKIRAVLDSE